MRPVVIEMRNGEPHIISCPKKVQVIIKYPKKRTVKKQFKTLVYRMKSLFTR